MRRLIACCLVGLLSIAPLQAARDFDGVDDVISCGSAAAIDNFATFTVSAWFYSDSAASNAYGVTKSDGTNGWHIEYDSRVGVTRIRFYTNWSTTDGGWSTPVDSIAINAWYHIAVTYDNSLTTNDPVIYINGASQSLTETSTPAGTAASEAAVNFTIGDRDAGPGSFFNGRIAEASYYNVILNADAIQGIRRCPLFYPNGLKLYVPLYGISSPELDLTGNGNVGTVTGAVRIDHPPGISAVPFRVIAWLMEPLLSPLARYLDLRLFA